MAAATDRVDAARDDLNGWRRGPQRPAAARPRLRRARAEVVLVLAVALALTQLVYLSMEYLDDPFVQVLVTVAASAGIFAASTRSVRDGALAQHVGAPRPAAVAVRGRRRSSPRRWSAPRSTPASCATRRARCSRAGPGSTPTAAAHGAGRRAARLRLDDVDRAARDRRDDRGQPDRRAVRPRRTGARAQEAHQGGQGPAGRCRAGAARRRAARRPQPGALRAGRGRHRRDRGPDARARAEIRGAEQAETHARAAEDGERTSNLAAAEIAYHAERARRVDAERERAAAETRRAEQLVREDDAQAHREDRDDAQLRRARGAQRRPRAPARRARRRAAAEARRARRGTARAGATSAGRRDAPAAGSAARSASRASAARPMPSARTPRTACVSAVRRRPPGSSPRASGAGADRPRRRQRRPDRGAPAHAVAPSPGRAGPRPPGHGRRRVHRDLAPAVTPPLPGVLRPSEVAHLNGTSTNGSHKEPA